MANCGRSLNWYRECFPTVRLDNHGKWKGKSKSRACAVAFFGQAGKNSPGRFRDGSGEKRVNNIFEKNFVKKFELWENRNSAFT